MQAPDAQGARHCSKRATAQTTGIVLADARRNLARARSRRDSGACICRSKRPGAAERGLPLRQCGVGSAPGRGRAGPSRVLAWLHAGDRALMFVLLSLHLAPLCLFAFFPTRDGPSHLEGAQLLLRWQRPDVVMLRDWFTPVMPLAPNWLDHVALAALSVVVEPGTAEKMLGGGVVGGLA